VTRLRAIREATDAFDEHDRDLLLDAAARGGTLHATESFVVATFGTARTIELPFGLGDTTASTEVGDVLGSIDLGGDGGPGGSGVLGAAALPFDPTARTGMTVPSLVCTWLRGEPTTWVTHVVAPETAPDPVGAARRVIEQTAPRSAPSRIVTQVERPEPEAFAEAVERCLDRIRSGDVEKVVLARAVLGTLDGPVDAATVARTLHAADPSCDLYAYPVASGRFIGASPELIVATSGGAVSAHPLAGTVALAGDDGDDERITWLANSAKNRAEHAVVVDDIVRRLAPLCESVTAAEAPSAVRLSTDARLGTWVDGKLAGARDAETAMATLAALHPTPAVGGQPRAAALALIAELEAAPRGSWAGPVGWVDADGTSSWTLGLRGIRVRGDEFEAWGGAGIVAASEPLDELKETEGKLRSVLRAFSG
jgi:isochorismate synthase